MDSLLDCFSRIWIANSISRIQGGNMSNKARFPGKPPRNSWERTRVSWNETKNDAAKDTEFSKVAKELKLNMKAFRHVYCLPQPVGKPFLGFALDDHRLETCKQKVAEINAEMISLKGFTASTNPTNSSGPQGENQRDRGCNQKSFNTVLQAMGSNAEVRNRPSLLEMRSSHTRERKLRFEPKYLGSARGNLSENFGNSTGATPKNVSSSEDFQDKISASADDTVPVRSSDSLMSGAGAVNSKCVYSAGNPERSVGLVQTPNFRKIKGARIKRVRPGDLDNYLGILRDLPCIPKITAKSLEDIDQVRAGSARSGKYLLETELDGTNYNDDSSLTNSCDECDSDATDTSILEIPKQFRFQGVRPKSSAMMIKALCPLDSQDVEQNGFPIVVDSENGCCPHKPLCFLCGSAGIQQLIFCTSCCEPFHPFCTGDDSLLSSFVAKTSPKSGQVDAPLDVRDILKIPIPVYYNKGPKPIQDLLNPISSILSPPLTPRPVMQLEKDLELEKELELNEQFLTWKCSRCICCETCRLHTREGNEKQNEFLKCSQCRLHFHTGCVKRNPKKSVSEKWACEECIKCKSCGKKRRIGHDDSINSSGLARKSVYCIDCFRQRQKGSYCPVCQKCYDDNDYDTKMMECGKCQKWIHAKCEGLSGEQYQVLSNLPESVEYTCRLCENSPDSFWRQAMRLEVTKGFDSVFRIFQKKAVSMCRKKRIMNFEDSKAQEACLSGTESKNDLNEDFSKPNELTMCAQPVLTSQDTCLEILSQSELKQAKVILNDFRKSPETSEQRMFLLKTTKLEPLEPKCRRDITPEREVTQVRSKEINAACRSLVIVPETPSPFKRIASFFDSVTTSLEHCEQPLSVVATYSATIKSLEEIFGREDQLKLEILREHFDTSVREIFPWFPPENSNLGTVENVGMPGCKTGPLSFGTEQPFSLTTTHEARKVSSGSRFSGMDPFQDVFWDLNVTDDPRHCSFCLGVGDFPPDFCGRLLWAGLTDWVHINCALWSSEVWEENDGGLQQVGAALNRSKNLVCAICNKVGASVSCCHTSCKTSFHFPCALNSDCALLDNKSIFCTKHINKTIHSNIQSDMQVMRQVYVDVDWLRKKEKYVNSSMLKVCIGSARIDRLGRLVPISVHKLENQVSVETEHLRSVLVPVGYKCSRLFWSEESPTSKTMFTVACGLPNSWQKRKRNTYQHNIHIVVNHSKCPSTIERKLNDIREFHNWIDASSVFVDEYKRDWLPRCPLEPSFVSDDDETTSAEDAEVQTSFGSLAVISKSLAGDVHDDPSPVDIFRDDANFFNEYLTPDAMEHLHSYVEDMMGDEWPELDTETCEFDHQAKRQQSFYQPKELILDYHIIQVDGACDDTSSSSSGSESESSSQSEEASLTDEEDTPAPVQPLLRRSLSRIRNDGTSQQSRCTKRPATVKKSTPTRILRSRAKKPRLEIKKPDIKCSSCKKTFHSEVSLSRHSKLCKPKFKPDRKANAKQPVEELYVDVAFTPEKVPNKRGRPKKVQPEIHSSNSKVQPGSSGGLIRITRSQDEKNTIQTPGANLKVKQSKEAVCSPSNAGITPSIRKSLNKKENTTKRNATATVNKYGMHLDAQQRLSCSKCKNVYRTTESLNKHVQTCYIWSSSDNDDDDDVKDADLSAESETLHPVLLVDSSSSSSSSPEPEIANNQEKSHAKSSHSIKQKFLEASATTVRGKRATAVNTALSSKAYTDSTAPIVQQQPSEISLDVTANKTILIPSSSTQQTALHPKLEQSWSGACKAVGSTGDSLTPNTSDAFVNSTFSGPRTMPMCVPRIPLISELGLDPNKVFNVLNQFQNNKDYTIQFREQHVPPGIPTFGPQPSLSSTLPQQITDNRNVAVAVTPGSFDNNNQSLQIQSSSASHLNAPNIDPDVQTITQTRNSALEKQKGVYIHPLPVNQNHSPIYYQCQHPQPNPPKVNHIMNQYQHQPSIFVNQEQQLQMLNLGSWTPRFSAESVTHVPSTESASVPTFNSSQNQTLTVTVQDDNGILSLVPVHPPPTQPNAFEQYQLNMLHLKQYLHEQLRNTMYLPQHQTLGHPYQTCLPHQQFGMSFPVHRPELSSEARYYQNYQCNMLPPHPQQLHPQGLPSENMTYILVQRENPTSSLPVAYPPQGGAGAPGVCVDPSPTLQIRQDVQSSCLTTAGSQSTKHSTLIVDPRSVFQMPPAPVTRCAKPNQEVTTTATTTGLQRFVATSGACVTTGKPRPCPESHQKVIQPGTPDKANMVSVVQKMHQNAQLNLSRELGLAVPINQQRPRSSVKTKIQSGNIRGEKQRQGLSVLKSTAPVGVLPKLLPATTVSPTMTAPTSMISSAALTPATTVSVAVCVPLITPPGKLPVSSPNVAVVRPMEHPLQKMSDQIQQIESSFQQPQIALLNTTSIPHSASSSDHSTPKSDSVVSKPLSALATVLSPISTTSVQSREVPQLAEQGLSENECCKLLTSPKKAVDDQGSMPVQNSADCSDAIVEVPSPAEPQPQEGPVLEVDSNKKKEAGGSNKSIKITLKRKEGGDSYSIDNITDPGSQAAPGAMRSLKIKAKITSGEQAGSITDVVVLPVVHTVPIPDPDGDGSNKTIYEDGMAPPPQGIATAALPDDPAPIPKIVNRLTHRAVIVYEVRCNDAVLFRSSDVRAVWDHIFETVQETTLNQNLPPLSYPATNISLPGNKSDAAASFNQLGLTHRAIQFLLEQLPGANKAAKQNHTFRFHEPRGVTTDEVVPETASGCARTEPYSGRKPFDMFGWLASKYRKPVISSNAKNGDLTKVADLPIAMKYRNLNKQGNKHLNVFWSKIHGRGLFTSKDIEENDMIIEYAGEVIRSSVSDLREKYYDSKGIGCYMFRIDDQYVVDATLKGNAARFINHSCEPNCRSKMMDILGKKHILIFATKKISSGDELTYDYKFPFEEVKIPCFCGSNKCRKFLN